jgi:hypothetical protein
MTPAEEHKHLKNEIRIALGEIENVACFNNESGVATFYFGPKCRLCQKGSKERQVKFGVGSGGADLIGIANDNGVGRFFAIEVKTGNAKLAANQEMFGELIVKLGGIHGVARSVADALRILSRAGIKLIVTKEKEFIEN